MTARGGPQTTIGMSAIKQRRLKELGVKCHPGTVVGEYVPFYFCPRSVMLYLLHMGNHPELNYKGGQGPIIHLESDLMTVIEWANGNNVRWAFTSGNAGARYALFHRSMDQLDELNWSAIAATDWRAPEVKEGKMAEFLVFEFVPFSLVERIGVRDAAAREPVEAGLEGSEFSPPVHVLADWYY